MSDPERSAKTVTRRTVRDARAARGPAQAAAVEAALAEHAGAALDVARAHLPGPVTGPGTGPDGDTDAGPGTGPDAGATVAVYRSLPGEPGTGLLREALRRAGHRVLLPVLLPDLDLDWVEDAGRADGPPGGNDGDHGDPLRPAGPRLGRDALVACTLVLVPALAVDAAGTRLGQGGGSYDRALARLATAPRRPLVLAVVHDDEVLAGPLPREPHDVVVDGALTPSGVVGRR